MPQTTVWVIAGTLQNWPKLYKYSMALWHVCSALQSWLLWPSVWIHQTSKLAPAHLFKCRKVSTVQINPSEAALMFVCLFITHTVVVIVNVIIVIIIILSTCYCICTESRCHRTVSNGFSRKWAPYNWKHCHSIMQGQSVEDYLTSVFAAVSEQAPWEILFAAQIIPWSTGCSESAEKQTQLGHFADFLNVGCVRHWSTKAVLSSSLMTYVRWERETINSMLPCI